MGDVTSSDIIPPRPDDGWLEPKLLYTYDFLPVLIFRFFLFLTLVPGHG